LQRDAGSVLQKTKSQVRLMNSSLPAEKKLVPGLFQIAACADDPHLVSRKSFKAGKTPLVETIINPKNLEAVLKVIARMEKPVKRRVSSIR
jgi:hypothetical protein